MVQKKIVGLFLLILTLCGCAQKGFYRRKEFLKRTFFATPLSDGPLTIFIHGTKTSLISKLVHQSDYPHGLVLTKSVQTNSIMTRLSYHLSEADPAGFPIDNFYFYTWPGKLTFESRLRAAEKLYSVIRTHNGPITIITHSHGCNVALNLAYWAQTYHDTSFMVDRLIFLAPPVQEVTKPYVHSPIFKRVYTFYSSADIMQVGDPQALYWESYAYTKPCTDIPLLSRRTFEPAPHILQTRILLDGQSPGHLNFLLARFLRKLPALLTLVTQAADNDGYARTRNLFIANIPLFDLPPCLVDTCHLKGRYSPRGTYHKTKRLVRQQQSASLQMPAAAIPTTTLRAAALPAIDASITAPVTTQPTTVLPATAVPGAAVSAAAQSAAESVQPLNRTSRAAFKRMRKSGTA